MTDQEYGELLDLSVDLAYQLQQCGAETYRVEECISHLMHAYGAHAETFAIPNFIIASLETDDEKHVMRMRRTDAASTDMDALERFNALCRRICSEKPSVRTAADWLKQEKKNSHPRSFPMLILGNALAAMGFGFFFHGTILDAVCAAICGISVGLSLRFMKIFRANLFFNTVAAGFVQAFLAQILARLGLLHNPDATIIGTLMLLVPGLLFTNSIRDVIYGDTLSGVNRLVQVFITAVALAVGVGAAVSVARSLFGEVAGAPCLMNSFFFECVGACIGCAGFCILFNIRGRAVLLCVLGGLLSWLIYTPCVMLGCSDVTGFVIGSAAVATYAEVMARVRKCPASPYLVISLIPLIPGSGIFYTMDFAARGEIDNFLVKGLNTGALAGALAVGVLLVSTMFRMWSVWNFRKLLKKNHH